MIMALVALGVIVSRAAGDKRIIYQLKLATANAVRMGVLARTAEATSFSTRSPWINRNQFIQEYIALN